MCLCASMCVCVWVCKGGRGSEGSWMSVQVLHTWMRLCSCAFYISENFIMYVVTSLKLDFSSVDYVENIRGWRGGWGLMGGVLRCICSYCMLGWSVHLWFCISKKSCVWWWLHTQFIFSLVHYVEIITCAVELLISRFCYLITEVSSCCWFQIIEEIDNNDIHIYEFPDCDSDEDEDFKQQDKELKVCECAGALCLFVCVPACSFVLFVLLF